MQPRSFIYTGHPGRVIFGSGTMQQLPQEVERLGARRALVLSTPEQEADAKVLADLLGSQTVGLFSGATMHTPVDISDFAADRARQLKADVLVAVGAARRLVWARQLPCAQAFPRSCCRQPMPV